MYAFFFPAMAVHCLSLCILVSQGAGKTGFSGAEVFDSELGLGEAKPGGFQTRVFPTFFGKGPDCVADPFGTVPRRCS